MVDENLKGINDELEKLTDEELDNVAGGTRQDFEDICKALGKSSTWNTRDGIRKLLWNKWQIDVLHWNTGDRGSKKNAPAEFIDSGGFWSKEAGASMNTESVIDIIKRFPKGLKN